MSRTRILIKTAVYGGFVAFGGALYFSSRIHANFKKQDFYTNSLELLRGYPPACNVLGTPIKARRLDLGDTAKNKVDTYNARIAIPLKGSRQSGVLHSWSSRDELDKTWKIEKLDIELETPGQKMKQWTFYIHPDLVDTVKPTQIGGDSDSIDTDFPVNSATPSHPGERIQKEDIAEELEYYNPKAKF